MLTEDINMTEKEFDILIAKACDMYCEKIAEEFLSLDTTGFEITDSARKRFEQILDEQTKINKNS